MHFIIKNLNYFLYIFKIISYLIFLLSIDKILNANNQDTDRTSDMHLDKQILMSSLCR